MTSGPETVGLHLGFPSVSIESIAMPSWAEHAVAAERAGFDCLWHSNERFFREMFVRMAVSSTSTSKIAIGGAIAEGFAVHPAITAQSIASIAELSGGRATLAIGAGGSGLPAMGIERRHVVETIEATYRTIDDLLAGEIVERTAPTFEAHRARLHFRSPAVPLWIAGRGRGTLELAGSIGAGAMVATFATPAGVANALDWVEASAARAGRRRQDFRVMSRVDTCIHPDPALALEGARRMVAKLLWMSYPDRRFVEAVGATVPDELERVIATRDYDAIDDAARLVDDQLVSALAWAGPPSAIAGRVIDIVRSTGVSDVGFWLLAAPGQSLLGAVELLASTVVAEVRSVLGVGTEAT